jgi:hypothetical protein
MSARRILHTAVKIGLITIGALLVIFQLVPYGREHSNPGVVSEPSWDQASTRALAVRACFDCHSNETRWPWYSHVAPVSWLVQRDVDVGRREVNFSEWHRTYKEAGESAETVIEGEMPPAIYLLTHPSARLAPEEARALAQGLTATLGSRANEGRHEED